MKAEVDALNLDKIYQDKDYDYVNEYVRQAKAKFIVADTVEVLRPMYLRKSQAEREKENADKTN